MKFPALQLATDTTTRMPSLEETAALVAYWHCNQVDKSGQPYIGHLIRVSRHLLRLFPDASETERHAAWLHDTLEDTEVTSEDLQRLNYSPEVIAIVEAVTKINSGVSYAERIELLVNSGNRSAMRVKLADLSDNADPARLAALTPDKARSLGKRYRAAIKRLSHALGQDA